MSVKQCLRAWGRLLSIQLFAVVAVWLGTYYPGLDIALAVLYLLVIVGEFAAPGGSWWQKLLLLLVWQLPLLCCVAIFWSGSYSYAALLYLAFVQQIWLTPLLPLLAGPWPQVTAMGVAAVVLYLAVFALSFLWRRFMMYNKYKSGQY